jgi:hypothetical protein
VLIHHNQTHAHTRSATVRRRCRTIGCCCRSHSPPGRSRWRWTSLQALGCAWARVAHHYHARTITMGAPMPAVPAMHAIASTLDAPDATVTTLDAATTGPNVNAFSRLRLGPLTSSLPKRRAPMSRFVGIRKPRRSTGCRPWWLSHRDRHRQARMHCLSSGSTQPTRDISILHHWCRCRSCGSQSSIDDLGGRPYTRPLGSPSDPHFG